MYPVIDDSGSVLKETSSLLVRPHQRYPIIRKCPPLGPYSSICLGSYGVPSSQDPQPQTGDLNHIEKRTGAKFVRIGAPQPADVAKAAAEDAASAMQVLIL